MIVLTVVSFNGAPMDGLTARFDELGGSIGRADGNQLVLPDPERNISRQHARVVFRSGQYAVVDNGSNPIAVNNQPLPLGQEKVLWPGDLLQIGGYVLKVSQGAAAPAGGANAFADLFGDDAQGLAAPAAAGGADPWAMPVPWNAGAAAATPAGPRPGATPPAPPPFAQAAPAAFPPAFPPPAPPAFPSPAPAAAPPWGAPPPPAWGAPAPLPAPAAPAAPGAIPDDWDFLSPAPAPGPSFGASPPAGGLAPAGLPIAAGGGESLDAMFGLGGGLSVADPLGAPQARALLQPNTAGHADPLLALAGTPAPVAPSSVADHASELNTPMPLPAMRASVPGDGAVPVAEPAAPGAGPGSPPRGAIFSWDDPPRDGRLVTLPGRPSPNGGGAHRPPAAAPPAPAPNPLLDALGDPLGDALAGFGPAAGPSGVASPVGGPVDSPHTVIRPSRSAMPVAAVATPPAAWPAPAAAPPAPAPTTQAPIFPATPAAIQPVAPSGASDPALVAALLQGLATPGLRIDHLTPELMLLLGQLLRESTRGAIELLTARAALKREMRAMMTMIQGRENNPLKFSPTVDAALLHLLGPSVAGFMPPAPAMRDAFDDLRAHQLGVMAGMKAAMEGMLQRFDPQQLESKLSGRAGLAGLIPATRKARLWEAFQQLFGQLSAEARDDVDALFGTAFMRAYEEQLDRLQADEPDRR